ncbi:TetR/AcrR family transcriptional regulator [Lactococcus formosensis]|uniref:TetR family transcriptional regulator n=1 Tax=Lactococcus garvieae TRF1 TaxID=1380772 RepID=V8ASN9_9LACT|nr:TetR/AcrR family transcriptional regulator [Lactococcus formosensis]ETD05615.1 hypothetical protein N568_0101675 [Lactococcus garvieae TRF1]
MIIINDTQLKIIDAFFVLTNESTSLHDITMQLIADKAGIRRQNIYKNHFNGIQDIIKTVHLLIDRDCKSKIKSFIISENNQELPTFIAEEILPLLYARRDWLKPLYNSSIDPDWIPFLREQYYPLIKMYYGNKIENISSSLNICPEFLYKLVIDNILSIISGWITSDFPDPPSIFRDKFIRLSSLSLDDLLNIDSKFNIN